MVDFTEVLGCLSEAFQADDLMVMEVLPEVEAVMWHLEEMKTSPGFAPTKTKRHLKNPACHT